MSSLTAEGIAEVHQVWVAEQEAAYDEWRENVDKPREEHARRSGRASAIKEDCTIAKFATYRIEESALADVGVGAYATRRLGQVLEQALSGLRRVASAGGSSAALAAKLLDDAKRRLISPENALRKRRSRAGGTAPAAFMRSRDFTIAVAQCVAQIQADHLHGKRRWGRVTLPAVQFGKIGSGADAKRLWIDGLLELVKREYRSRIEPAGWPERWTKTRRDQARREIGRMWNAERDEQIARHREWVSDGMLE